MLFLVGFCLHNSTTTGLGRCRVGLKRASKREFGYIGNSPVSNGGGITDQELIRRLESLSPELRHPNSAGSSVHIPHMPHHFLSLLNFQNVEIVADVEPELAFNGVKQTESFESDGTG